MTTPTDINELNYGFKQIGAKTRIKTKWKFSSFELYTISGIIKTLYIIVGLWFMVDVLDLGLSNNMKRIIVLGVGFILTHYIYKKIGYAK